MNVLKGNLLNVNPDIWIAHCISQDYKAGAGIALQINKRYGLTELLNNKYSEYKSKEFYPSCLIVNNVINQDTCEVDRAGIFNLVTQEKYNQNPTLETLEDALKAMYADCFELGIREIAIPQLGCGLDKLDWKDVNKLVEDIFENTEYPVSVTVVKQALAYSNNF